MKHPFHFLKHYKLDFAVKNFRVGVICDESRKHRFFLSKLLGCKNVVAN
jgi:hypothetical protein